MLTEDEDSFVRRSAAIALSRLNVRESLTAVFEQFRSAQTRLAQRELALALGNLVHGGDLYYQIRRHEAQGMAAVLEEAVDEALGEAVVDHEGQRCFEQMVVALRGEGLEAVRSIAAEAIKNGRLHRPSGNAGELADYLLGRGAAEPWAQEHAALLIFLLFSQHGTYRLHTEAEPGAEAATDGWCYPPDTALLDTKYSPGQSFFGEVCILAWRYNGQPSIKVPVSQRHIRFQMAVFLL